MRILVWGLTNAMAGTEAVITSVVSSIGERAQFDFLTMEEVPNHADVIQGKNRAIVLPNKRTSYLEYKKAIRSFFREHAFEYDAIWVNINILNNIDALRLGCKYGIPRRIAHAHNAGNDGKLHHRFLCRLNKPRFPKYVTDRWACSEEAGRYLFGSDSFVSIPNAIDIYKFAFDVEARIRVRNELHLGNSNVIGSVGRLTEQKNQKLLIECMPAVLSARGNTILVIVGEGPLEGNLKRKARELGVEEHVVFTGVRTDIKNLLSAFDVFAMPSLFEGLPVTLLEAQASGLPCLISDAISTEAIISENVERISIGSIHSWEDAMSKDIERRNSLVAERACYFTREHQRVVIWRQLSKSKDFADAKV